jgi:hypothetical protein
MQRQNEAEFLLKMQQQQFGLSRPGAAAASGGSFETASSCQLSPRGPFPPAYGYGPGAAAYGGATGGGALLPQGGWADGHAAARCIARVPTRAPSSARARRVRNGRELARKGAGASESEGASESVLAAKGHLPRTHCAAAWGGAQESIWNGEGGSAGGSLRWAEAAGARIPT